MHGIPSETSMRGFMRFGKKAAVGLLVFVGVLALLWFGTSSYFKRQGNRELGEFTAELDAKDPGWRLEPILTRREQQPIRPDEDAAPIIFQAVQSSEPDWVTVRNLIEWGELDH